MVAINPVTFCVQHAGRCVSALWYRFSALLAFLWPTLRWLFLIVAIVHQGYREYVFTDLAFDKAAQIAAARSLIEGHGLGYSQADIHDLSRSTFIPLYQWPPGYSVALVPFLWITHDNWWSALLLDWVGGVVFFAAWFVILEALTPILGVFGKLLVWFLWAFHVAPIQDTSSGLLAVALFSAGLAVGLHLLTSGKYTTSASVCSALFLAASASVRYAYWPLVTVMPLALMICAVRWDRRLWRVAVVHLLVAGGLLAALAFFQRTSTGHTTFLSAYWPEARRGWWPANLKKFCPFPIYAFLPEESWPMLAARLRWHVADLMKYRWIGSAIVLSAFGYCLSVARRNGGSPPGAFFFFACAGLTFVLTVGMLGYLAARCIPSGSAWAFVDESRYYAPLYGFFVVSTVAVLIRAPFLWQSLRGKLLLAGVALVLFVPCWMAQYEIHSLRWIWRRYVPGMLARYGKDATCLMPALDRDRSSVFIQDASVSSHGWLALAHMANGRGAVLYGNGELRTSKPVCILAAVPRKRTSCSPLFDFCRRHAAQKIGELHDYADCDLVRFTLNPPVHSACKGF